MINLCILRFNGDSSCAELKNTARRISGINWKWRLLGWPSPILLEGRRKSSCARLFWKMNNQREHEQVLYRCFDFHPLSRKNRWVHCKVSWSLSCNRNTSGITGLHARFYTQWSIQTLVEWSENHLSGRGNGTGAFWWHRISGVGVSMAHGSFFLHSLLRFE